jgi:CRISPR-associated protein Csb2
VRYTEGEISADAAVPASVFDLSNVVVFSRVGGPRLPITSVAGVSRQFRKVLMSVAQQPVPELLSGHQPDGAPSERTHLAIVPLPFVGRQHADGAILGLALFFPRACDPEQCRAVLKVIGLLELKGRASESSEEEPVRLLLGDAGTLELERIQWGEARNATLNPERWCRPSRAWASATPVALDRNPGNLHDTDARRRHAAFLEAEQSIRDAIERIFPSCVVSGAAKPRNYPRFPIEDRRHQRVLVHVRLVFDRPVRGPILLGAGRYQGLGLCLPIDMASEGGMVTR